MQRPFAALLAVLVLVLAGIAALALGLLQDAAAPAAVPDVPPPGTAPGVRAAPDAPPGPTQDPAPASPGLRVDLEVRQLEQYLDAGLAVTARWIGGERVLPAEVVAGVGAAGGAAVPEAGAALVRVHLGGGRRLLRRIGVERGTAPALTIGTPAVVRGTVRDDEGRPLAAARVSAGELGPDGALREIECGADGRFELEVPVGDGVPMLARAEGRASRCQFATVALQHAVDLTFALPPEGVLVLQLAGEARDLSAARAVLMPGSTPSTEVLQIPFFEQTIAGGVRFDERGGAVVRGLPRTGELTLVLAHPLAAAAASPVRLDGARTTATLPLRLGQPRTGRVVDAAGRPIASAHVVLRAVEVPAGGRAGARLLPPWADAIGCHHAWTGEDGGFALGAVDGPARIAVRAGGWHGRELDAAAAFAAPIVLAERIAGTAAIRVLAPRAGTPWSLRFVQGGGAAEPADAVNVAPGEAHLVPLRPGRYAVAVTAVAGEAAARSDVGEIEVVGVVDVQPRDPE